MAVLRGGVALGLAIVVVGCGKGLRPLNAGSSLLSFTSALYSFSTNHSLSATDLTLTLRNRDVLPVTGLSALGISNSAFLYKGGAYPGAGGTCGGTIDAESDCTLVVSFLATQSGGYEGNLSVGSGRSQSATATLSGFALGGGIDSTFGVDGVVLQELTTDPNFILATTLQPDGKIVGVGAFGYTSGTNYDSLIIRLSSDGSFDTSFDSDGSRVTALVGASDRFYAVALQTDGKIVAGGGDSSNFYVARFTSAGALDATFDSDGVAFTDFGSFDSIQAVAIDSQGRTLAAGSVSSSGRYVFGVARYTTDGAPDTSFSGDGMAMMTLGTVNNNATSMVIQPDGKILLAGQMAIAGADVQFAVGRLLTDGSVDSTFATNGMATLNISTGADLLSAVTLQPDGKIVGAGYVSVTNNSSAVCRFNSDGTLDSTFNGTGVHVIHLADPSSQDRLTGVTTQPDGKIVAAGMAFVSGIYRFSILRFHSDGTIDSTFDEDGFLIKKIGSYDSGASGVLRQPDGKIVAVGNGMESFVGYADVAILRVGP